MSNKSKIDIAYTENYEVLYNTRSVYAKRKPFDVEFYPEDSKYTTPEFIHLTKGNNLIVIDYEFMVEFNEANLVNRDVNNFIAKTNIKENKVFLNILKNITKNGEDPLKDNAVYRIISTLYYEYSNDEYDFDVSEIYMKKPDKQIKSLTLLEKNGKDINCDLY